MAADSMAGARSEQEGPSTSLNSPAVELFRGMLVCTHCTLSGHMLCTLSGHWSYPGVRKLKRVQLLVRQVVQQHMEPLRACSREMSLRGCAQPD